MKRILLPIITLLLIGLSLISCDLFGDNDSDVKRLLFIDVTPKKSVFTNGDNIKENITVKSFYSDGSDKTLQKEDYRTNLLNDKVTSNTNSVTVSYTEGGITKTKDVHINVTNSKTLISLDVKVSPTNYIFSEGDNVKEHLIVKGIYSDGSENIINSYLTDIETVTSTTKSVTVTYGDKSNTLQIFVRDDSKTLFFIDVTLSPTDYVFSEGDDVKEHLKVEGFYSDGSVETITNTDCEITTTTNSVTVTYGSKTKTIPISVRSSGSGITLNDIEVITDTDILYEGDDIKDHLTVKGVYSDGIKTISKEGYSTNLPNDKVTSTSTSVTITYTDGGEKQTKSIPITLGDLSDYDIDNIWNTYLEGVDKSNVFSISFVKGKPSDVTESVGTYHRLSFYKKDNDLYVVGDRRIRFSSICRLMFEDFPNVEQINFTNVDTSNVTDMSCMFMFEDSSNLTSITFGDNFDTSNVTDMKKMFSNCKSLETINISSFDTSKVTDMEGMFEGCEKLTSITFGNNFVTPNVTDMSDMFLYCKELTELNLSKFDTSKVTTMKKMFDDCFKLTSITFGNNFVTPNVTDMSDMFWSCELLTSLNLSSFDTSKVTTMKNMFSGCKKLTSITFGNDFVTPNVTDMSDMFFYCKELTELNLSRFVVSDTTVKSDMFDNCGHNGTTVTINPTYESFFNETDLGNTTNWTYTSSTDLGTYTKN